MFRSSGEITKITMVIHGFEHVPPEGELTGFWKCHWSLEKIHPDLGFIAGEDLCDSLLNTFAFLDGLIGDLKRKGIDVWWIAEGDQGGFRKSQE